MSEDTKPRINLKALKPLQTVVSDIKIEAVIENPAEEVSKKNPPAEVSKESPQAIITSPTPLNISTEKQESSAAKISLGMIKKNVSTPSNTQVNEEIEKQENPSNWIFEWEKTVEKEMGMFHILSPWESANILEPPSKEVLEFIESQKEVVAPEIEKKEETPVAFQNYESWFKKQSSNVLKRIQNFRYTPKTRTGFLLWLSILCFWSIALMMIFFPEKHSFSIYKASILDIVTTEETSIAPEDVSPQEETIIPSFTEEKSNEIEDIPEDENPWLPEENDESWVNVRQEKKEKLRQHLLKKYSS